MNDLYDNYYIILYYLYAIILNGIFHSVYGCCFSNYNKVAKTVDGNLLIYRWKYNNVINLNSNVYKKFMFHSSNFFFYKQIVYKTKI